MSRIIVLCEGDTEELAIRYFIARQWESEGRGSTGLKAIDVGGKLEKIARFAEGYLDDQEVLAVFTLIDLHEMNKVTHQPHDSLETKIGRVRAWLRAQVSHAREDDFFPHVCVHEIEAWILAEGEALASRLNDRSIQPDPHAELKNFQNPPSDRLNELFLRIRKRRYHKIIDGTSLFKAMQFRPVYSACKHFREFYDDLRAAARQ